MAIVEVVMKRFALLPVIFPGVQLGEAMGMGHGHQGDPGRTRATHGNGHQKGGTGWHHNLGISWI